MGNSACVATGGTPHKLEITLVNNTEIPLHLDTREACGRQCDHRGFRVSAGKIVEGQEPPGAIQPDSTRKFTTSGREGSAVAPNGKVFYGNEEAGVKIELEWICSGWSHPGGSSTLGVVIKGETHDGLEWGERMSGDVDMDNGVVTLRYRMVLSCTSQLMPSPHDRGEVKMRVMTLNTWGMPKTIGGPDKEERIRAIGDLIATGEYDLVLLQELWMRTDHAAIQQQVVKSFYMTEFDDLNPEGADGVVSPYNCSGLAIVSRYPLDNKMFSLFKKQGCSSTVLVDGEYFSGKGVGVVTVSPASGIAVDVLVTHLISMVNNTAIRDLQVDQLLGLVKSSTSDFIILGGDLNISRARNGLQTYYKITEEMTDALKKEYWNDANFATYGNNRNTYTYDKEEQMYDYMFYRKNTIEPSTIWTDSYNVPLLKTPGDNPISLSDHEAVACDIHMAKVCTK